MLRVLRRLIPGADVVHVHSLYLFPTIVASRLAKARGVPYVLRPHGTLDPYIRRRHRLAKYLYHWLVEDSTLRHASAVHFTTAEERDHAGPALPADTQTCVIPLGIDLAEFRDLPSRDAARQSLGIDGTPLVWVFVGRLNHKKGLDILAPAFAQFSRTIPNTHLIVAGPDDDGLAKPFLEQCVRAGVAGKVRLMGFQDRSEMKRVLAAADFWILPSYSENFGVAVVEAMAAKVPVLISDRVNISGAVQGAGAGVVTEANVQSVVDGMLRLATLPMPDRLAMGNRGRELCRACYSSDRSAQELEALYARLADRRGPRSA
jgi:glycosyltransferase involved in cell wall biosynthesis